MQFLNNLFEFNTGETKGDYLFYRFFELLIIYFVLTFVWKWAFYIPKLGNVVLPLGIANYIDVSVMFEHNLSMINAVLITLLLGVGLFRLNRFAYLAALLLFHLQYVSRFSQGEISHGSNLVAMALLSFAVSEIVFKNRRDIRKFALGLIIFFIGLGYTSAGVSKLIGTGIGWVDGRHLWLWMGERSTDVFSQFGEFEFNYLQEMIFEYRWLGTIILTFGLLTEFFGFTFWFRKTRPFITILIVGMHIGILATMNINFPTYVYVVLLVGLPWPRFINYLLEKKPDSYLNRKLEKKLGYSR